LAGIQGRDGGKLVVAHLAEPDAFPRLTHLWADGAYGGTVEFAARYGGLTIELVTRPEGAKGFILLPRRWVVERSFAWVARFRRLARDYERLPQTLAGLPFLAFVILLLTRLTALLSESACQLLGEVMVLGDPVLSTAGCCRY
jgi:transposase